MCAAANFDPQNPAPWRLPTVKELLTLVDETPHDEADGQGKVAPHAIDRNAFPATPVDVPYVTAQATTGQLWLVDLRDGHVDVVAPSSTGPYRVRCVHTD